MPKGPRRRQVSNVNVVFGFCVSCGVTRSSRFLAASEKWSAFYNELPNLKKNYKRGNPKICNACYCRLRNASKPGVEEDQEQGLPNDDDGDDDISNKVKLATSKPIIKKSSIGGNGLFAERDYEEGEFVAEYGGRILSRDETEGKDQSYFKVIGVDKHNGIIDGKYDFGDTLGRYINTPMKREHPNCRWYEFNKENKTITIKTNKAVKCGQEFTIRYSPPIREALHARKKRGRPPGKKDSCLLLGNRSADFGG